MIRIRSKGLEVIPGLRCLAFAEAKRPSFNQQISININNQYRFYSNSTEELRKSRISDTDLLEITSKARQYLLAKGSQEHDGFILPTLLPVDDGAILGKVLDFSSDYTAVKGTPFAYNDIAWRGNASIRQHLLDILFMKHYRYSDERKDYIFDLIYNEKNLTEWSKKYGLWKIICPLLPKDFAETKPDDPIHASIFKAYIGAMHLHYGERDILFQDYLDSLFEPMVERYTKQWEDEGRIETPTKLYHEEANTRKRFANMRKKVTPINGKERLSTVTKCMLKFHRSKVEEDGKMYNQSTVIINKKILGQGEKSNRGKESERFAAYFAIKYNKYLVLQTMKDMRDIQLNTKQLRFKSPMYGHTHVLNNEGNGYKLRDYINMDLLREKPKDVWDRPV